MNDTWEWDGADWTQMQDVGPPPRSRTALAFDSTRGRTVLFGGSGTADGFGDTWEWDGSDWTQIQDVGPSARSGHALAFDAGQQRSVLFGGRAGGGLTGDTWEWDGNAWTQVDDAGPPVRELHGMVYAADRKRTVLFGGIGANGLVGDTWEWDATRWTHLQDVGPTRAGLAMAAEAGTVALFGGAGGAQANPTTVLGDTWEWDGAHWTERQDMGPAARWQHAMAFDSARDRLVLFGGTTTPAGDSLLGDTWEAAGNGGPGSASSGVVLASLDLKLDQVSSRLNGNLGLSGPAPPGGVVVPLSVDFPLAGVALDTDSQTGLRGPPWSVAVTSGAAGTALRTRGPVPVPFGTTVTFTASLGGVQKTSSVRGL
jgi:hypothetical protein